MAAAKNWAAQILELCPMSIRASKQAVYRGLAEPSVEAALKNQFAYPAVSAMFKSEDFIEGPMAFMHEAPRRSGRGDKMYPRPVAGIAPVHERISLSAYIMRQSPSRSRQAVPSRV